MCCPSYALYQNIQCMKVKWYLSQLLVFLFPNLPILVHMQPEIDAFPCKKLRVCTYLCNLAVTNHCDAVGIIYCGQPMRYDNACATTASPVQCVLNNPFVLCV